MVICVLVDEFYGWTRSPRSYLDRTAHFSGTPHHTKRHTDAYLQQPFARNTAHAHAKMTMNSTTNSSSAMPQGPLLDIRSLWRIPASISKKGTATLSTAANAGAADSRPRARLKSSASRGLKSMICPPRTSGKLGLLVLGPSESATAGSDDTVVAIISDLLRDKVEDKSLPWYAESPCNRCLTFSPFSFTSNISARCFRFWSAWFDGISRVTSFVG